MHDDFTPFWERFLPFYFRGFIQAKAYFFGTFGRWSLFFPKMEQLGQKECLGAVPVPSGWEARLFSAWVGLLFSPFHNDFFSPRSPYNHLPKKWTSLSEGSRDGTQLEMEEHISLHVHFLFQLPVKIRQRVWRCVFLLTWIKWLCSLDTAMVLWCHLSNTVHWTNEDNLPLPLCYILD